MSNRAPPSLIFAETPSTRKKETCLLTLGVIKDILYCVKYLIAGRRDKLISIKQVLIIYSSLQAIIPSITTGPLRINWSSSALCGWYAVEILKMKSHRVCWKHPRLHLPHYYCTFWQCFTVWDMNLRGKVSLIHVWLLHCTQYKPGQLYLSCLSCADSSHKPRRTAQSN